VFCIAFIPFFDVDDDDLDIGGLGGPDWVDG
jgi:hypothetical protein